MTARRWWACGLPACSETETGATAGPSDSVNSLLVPIKTIQLVLETGAVEHPKKLGNQSSRHMHISISMNGVWSKYE